MKALSMATPITGLVASNTTMMMMPLTLMVPGCKPMLTYRKLHVSTYCITQYCGNIPIYMTVCKIYPEDIEIEQPHLSDLIQKFIYDQQHPDDCSNSSSVSALPTFYGMITIYPSAVATFHAPSDLSGIGGMRRERIRAVNSWRKGPSRYDTIFVNTDPSAEGMRGLNVARVRLFFLFSHDGIEYSCALVHWFSRVGDLPDVHTGMWVVKPDMSDDGENIISIIHLDTVVRACHLIPVFGPQRVSRDLSFTDTLDTFTHFYVNKYVDHHAFEVAF
jgi:hypothetical protein